MITYYVINEAIEDYVGIRELLYQVLLIPFTILLDITISLVIFTILLNIIRFTLNFI